MKKAYRSPVIVIMLLFYIMMACTEQKEHLAPAIHDEDSAALMTTYGINMLISDSGVIKYRIVTERSVTNQNVNPKRTIFDKGILLTQFDEHLHVQAYIQADTAYKYDEQRLLELRGRVRILSKDGVKFRGEELFWDQDKHEYYSNMYSYFETPERTLEGHYFRSDESMRKYYVSNTRGSFMHGDMVGEDTVSSKPDTVKAAIRQPAIPRARQ